MVRIEPPKLAEWLLENLVPPAERDEALAGDLEEHYRAGRSDAWYWRQTAAAVATGWGQYLGRRRTMLVFAFLWSVLAPAWYVTTNDFEAAHDFGKVWGILGPFMLVAWTALHAAFLWAGLMVYQLVHTFAGKPLPRKQIRRAFWIVPLVLPPVYGITFVFTALYGGTLPSLEHAKLAATVLGQIADLSILANLIRIPYFLTLAAALWGTTQQLDRNSRSALIDGVSSGTPTDWHTAVGRPSRRTVERFFAFVVAAGVMNALISGFLLCRLPPSNTPTLSSLLLRAAVYVGLGALAGMAGAWIYWNNPASPFRDSGPVDFRLFALACAAGWIWLPALVILYEQITAITAFVAAIAAFALAAGLRRIPLDVTPERPAFALQPAEEAELFSDSFLRPKSEGSGMLIALSIYGAGFAIATQTYFGASMLLALAAFLVGWRRTVQLREPRSHQMVRCAVRLALVALPAVLITAWALLTGVQYRARMAVLAATQATEGKSSATEKAVAKSAARGFGGYESVILWPFPEKKQIVAPQLEPTSFLAPGTTRPLVLRFDGPYWYLQPPDQRPGSDAHQAHGTPLGVHIESNNSLPLVMEARQRLGESIPLSRCGRIEVDLENRDQNLGVVAVVLLLEDSATKGHPQLDVGRQQLVTGEPETSGMQSFLFRLPQRAAIRRFDSVTVMLLPESGHEHIGPRIAVSELRLYPR